jgi:hypothetical protein
MRAHRSWLVGVVVMASFFVSAPSAFAARDSLVTSGSPSSPFPQNKQNEPAVTVDPVDTSLAVAGVNEEIDNAPCVGSACPFTPGIGDSGVYFSFDGGLTWSQPTYRGLSARTGTTVANGPIGTVPNYFEAGLESDGDPTLAFGPRPDASGKFSWSNGARLYYGNLTSNLNAKRSETFRGAEAVAVSFTDDAVAAAAGNNSAWSSPVVVTKQNSALFSDKPDVWADNASSSPFFGSLYECNIAFRSNGGSGEPVVFSRSTDGGKTFSASAQETRSRSAARAVRSAPTAKARSSCSSKAQ